MTIKLDGISKRFGDHLVISGVSLEVQTGELFVLLGGSGSGKSTILRLIAGLTQLDAGRIFLMNRDVTDLAPQERDTGFVFQHYAMFKHMSVADNVEFGLKVRKVPAAERRRKREEMLELVGLSGFGTRRPSQLSGGQRQRVALARALAFQPDVLLLDEPFGALDVKIRVHLRQTLKNVQDELGVTTILVTHDQEEAFELGDRIGILERGKLIEIGAPEDLYYRPASESAATFLGSGNVIVGRCEKGLIRLGKHLMNFPNNAPAHDEGGPVRVLFRPEAIEVSQEEFPKDQKVISLGESMLSERIFTGPLDRLRFEVPSLQGSRPLKPALQYGQRYPVVDVVKRSATLTKSEVGKKLFLGITQYHVLEPSGIRMLIFENAGQDDRTATRIADVLMLASHGIATLVTVTPDGDARDAATQSLKDAAESMQSAATSLIEQRVRAGQATRELVLEVQEHFYDFVVIAGPQFQKPELPELEPIVRRLLVYSRIPVLIGSAAPESFKKILICTAGGEPGKGDIRLGGRIARHTRSLATIFHAMSEPASAAWKRSIHKHFEQAHALLEAYGVSSDAKVAPGPWDSAVRTEAVRDYDLIVLGVTGAINYGVADFALDLVRSTGRCVLLVPPGEGLS